MARRTRSRLRAFSGRSGSMPALDLNYATDRALLADETFSRPSHATEYDSTGKLTFAPNNLLLYSSDLSNAAWNTFTSTATRNPTNVVFSGSGSDYVYQGLSAPAGNYILSATISSATKTQIGVSIGTTGQAQAVTSTPTRYSWSVSGSISFIGFDNRVSDGGDGAAGTMTITDIQLERVTYETSPRTYNATTSAAYYGPRFDYDPATLTSLGLLVEEARTNLFTYSEQLDHADWSVDNITRTANAAAAPDGTSTADTLDEGVANGRHILVKQPATAVSTAYTYSVFVKDVDRRYVVLLLEGSGGVNYAHAYFDLQSGTVTDTNAGSAKITSVGNGWYRISITGTSDASATASYAILALSDRADNSTGSFSFGHPSYLGTNKKVYVWGAQLEAGSFATSYIPTAATSVTRSADVVTNTSSTFTTAYNDVEGTFVTDYICNQPTGQAGIFSVNNIAAAADNRIDIRHNGNTYVSSGGVQNNGPSWTSAAVNTSSKVAFACKQNDFAVCVDGGTITTDTSQAMPVAGTINRLVIGSLDNAGYVYLNGHIARLRYYNTRLSDADLQTLTT